VSDVGDVTTGELPPVTVNTIAVDTLRLDGGTQPRAELNLVIIAEYAEAMQTGAQFPPIIVFYDGTQYWVADGFHRVHAAKNAGLEKIPADIRQGTRRDAVLYSVGANAQHGLRRANADKRRAVETLLHDDEWRKWSDREIARRCCVHHTTVIRIRQELSLVHCTSEPRTYITKHGTVATMNTASIGTSALAAPVLALAKEHGVTDTKTVRLLDEVRQKSPILFKEIAQSGAVLGVDGNDIPLSEASATDIRLAVDEEARERAIRYQMHRNGMMKPAHVSYNSGENEWYTPAAYLEVARRVMGAIDIDPASSEVANQMVQAAQFFTAADDGLTKDWHGRVWMNPPYAQPLIAHFCEKLADEVRAGNVTQACVLVNNATETVWFQSLLDIANAVCFIRGRVRFLDMTMNPNGAPLQGQALLYMGPDVAAFRAAAADFGKVLYA